MLKCPAVGLMLQMSRSDLPPRDGVLDGLNMHIQVLWTVTMQLEGQVCLAKESPTKHQVYRYMLANQPLSLA
jgi:hypothetical protein